MKTLIIRRIATGNHGTFGNLVYRDIPFALTLEREWLNNATNISCIPAGEYTCERVDSPRFGNTFEVKDVPNRTHILFHKGNLDDDSHGCILVGEQFEVIKGSPGVASSRQGFNQFMILMNTEDKFRLIIVDDWKSNLSQ